MFRKGLKRAFAIHCFVVVVTETSPWISEFNEFFLDRLT